MKLTHVITGLGAGGAEGMLRKLLVEMRGWGWDQRVISLVSGGAVADDLDSLGYSVSGLDMTRGRPDPKALYECAKLIRGFRPDVVQTWMYHADLLGGLAARLAVGVPVVWNLRHSRLSVRANGLPTVVTARLCALLSRRIPNRIICCSEAAKATHLAMGYAASRMIVIPNGFDPNVWKPDHEEGRTARARLGIAPDAHAVGLVARWHAEKDHATFVAAADEVLAVKPETVFMLCGDGICPENAALAALVRRTRHPASFRLLGPLRDVRAVYHAAEVVCLSSSSEGFPNSIGEAMLCERPCAVTAVGDNARIVGPWGRVVRPRSPRDLARALLELLDLRPEERATMGRGARGHISRTYNVADVAYRYRSVWEDAAQDRRRRQAS